MAKLISIGINKTLRRKAENHYKNDFLKLLNISEKTIENVRKRRVIKLVTTERKSNYLVLEPNKRKTK